MSKATATNIMKLQRRNVTERPGQEAARAALARIAEDTSGIDTTVLQSAAEMCLALSDTPGNTDGVCYVLQGCADVLTHLVEHGDPKEAEAFMRKCPQILAEAIGK